MKRYAITILVIIGALLSGQAVIAEDGEPATRYVQAARFNSPLLEGWENQSGEDSAQFRHPASQATIRTALQALEDPRAAAEADLRAAFGFAVGEPLHQDKAHLADGTWTVLIYDVDETSAASVMARRVASETVVVSFVESHPDSRVVMATIPQTGDPRSDASLELEWAASALTSAGASDYAEPRTVTLTSGEWLHYDGDGQAMMGMVFGNDSYVALAEGETEHLEMLAEAYNRALLGFFVTPDNSRYLALALAAVFGILALLLLSFAWRGRGIRNDLALIAALREDDLNQDSPL